MLLLLIACAFVVVSQRFAWFEPLDRLVYDTVIANVPAPLHEDVVIVALDDASLDRYGRWPWPRELQAQLFEALAEFEPRMIAVDIVYATRTTPPADQSLAAALGGLRYVALPIIIDALAQAQQPIEILPFPDLLTQAPRLGHVQIERDADTLVRGANLFQGVGTAYWPHLMLGVADDLRQTTTPSCEDRSRAPLMEMRCGYTRIPFAGPRGTVPQVSARHLLAHLAGDAEVTAERLSASLEGKVVLVGATALGVGDLITSPLGGDSGPLSGVEFNANLLSALLRGTTVQSASTWAVLALGLLLVCMTSVSLPRLSAKQALTFTATVTVMPLLITAVTLSTLWVHLPLANASVATLLMYPLWSWRRHEVAWSFITGELDRIDAEERAWRARNVISGVATQRSVPHNPMQALEQLLGAQVETAPDGATFVQRGEGLSATERSLLEDTVHDLSGTQELVLPAERLARQIGRLEARARALRNGRDLGLAGLGRMANGAVIVSALGFVQFANASASRMLGVVDPGSQDLLERLRDVPPPLGVSWQDIWRSTVLDKQPHAFESTLPGGADAHPVFVAVEPLETGTETAYAPFWIITLSDLTEVREAQAQREEALAFLSHDIRSPLTSVLALLQQAGERTPLLDAIERYARKGLSTSEQFLQLSRLQLQAHFERYPLQLEEVIQNAAEQVYFIAQEKGIALKVDTQAVDDREDGLWIQGNGELLERTFLNLLTNAIKYSAESDAVSITLNVAGETACVAVADRGHGIPADELPHIFDPYFRSAEPTLSRHRGAGLGLRFVKTVIDRHGGRIEVASTWGEGTTLRVYLPLDHSVQSVPSTIASS